MEKQKYSTAKKSIFFIIGGLLVVGTIFGGNLGYISDWSTAELIGYNIWSLIAIFGGAYLVYLSIKK